MFVDTHCHIDFDVFDCDRDVLLDNIFDIGDEAGLTLSGLVIPGTCHSRWERCIELAKSYHLVYTSIRVHPWFILNLPLNISLIPPLNNTNLFGLLTEYASRSNCIAVGECGLDKTIKVPLQVQQDIFAVHLQVAKQSNLPLIIHATKAHNEIIRQLKSTNTSCRGVIHGFSGSYELAKTYIDMGFLIGVGGTITYPRAKKTRDAVARIPIEAIVLESDAPDMPIAGRQGQRNSPEYIVDIARVLADLRGVPLDYVAAKTTQNASAIFGVSFN